jgi:hypothetical protein
MCKFLIKLGVLNDDCKVSWTNITFMSFTLIAGFKFALGGTDFSYNNFTLKVQALSLPDVFSFLVGALNYGHKRMTLNGKDLTDTIKSLTNGDNK